MPYRFTSVLLVLLVGSLLLGGAARAQDRPAAEADAPDAGPPNADTTAAHATVAVPVPDRGVIYFRRGPTNGRRIVRPRRLMRQRPRAMRCDSAGVVRPVPVPADALTERDLRALEARLLRQLDRQIDRLADALYAPPRLTPQGTPYILLPPAQRGRAPDTLFLGPALTRNLGALQPPARPRQPDERPPAAVRPSRPDTLAPLVEYIERSIIDRGLFRTINVNFEFDESTLLPAALPTLDAVGEVMARNPELQFEVGGHTDSIGSEAYNRALSQARAEAVETYLVDVYGIDGDRIVPVGYGESRPVADNDTPTGRTLNRRVEFSVIE